MQKFKAKLWRKLPTLPIAILGGSLGNLWDKGFTKSGWLTIFMIVICSIYSVVYLTSDWFEDDEDDEADDLD